MKATTTSRPYPVTVRHRDLAGEPVPQGGGLEVFDTEAALEINRARLDHLASLELPLEGKRVLDVGSGVGHLAQFFVKRGGSVVCVDGREENIASLRARYPGLASHVWNVEREPLVALGRFDVVFCYGLIYHLENLLAGLRNMASVCDSLLLLESLVCDHASPVTVLEDEPRVHNQALSQLGSRPSPAYVAMALDRIGFPHVYGARVPPAHPDFRFEWRNDLSISRPPHNIRCIFVASRREIESPHLVPLVDAG